MNQNDAMNAMKCSVRGQNIQDYFYGDMGSPASITITITQTQPYPHDPPSTLWGYWLGIYYPQVIRESYPVYFQEKAMDKGKQAFELLKALMDKGLVKVDKVKDFIEAMDTILKTL